MGLYDNAVLAINTGNYFIAEPGTLPPTNLLSPGPEWKNIGHTSLEELLGVTSEGGEATVLGTLQSKSLRTSYSARTESITFTAHQWDEDTLKLYFGRNMVATSQDSRFHGVPETPQPTKVAFLVVMVDGEENLAFWAQAAEIIRGDDMSLSDTESLAGLPLTVSPKKWGSNAWTWAITPIAANPNATGATAGAPGSFTPSGATPPPALNAMGGITASPATAWTTGQYVVLADDTEAHWTGSAWEAGRA